MCDLLTQLNERERAVGSSEYERDVFYGEGILTITTALADNRADACRDHLTYTAARYALRRKDFVFAEDALERVLASNTLEGPIRVHARGNLAVALMGQGRVREAHAQWRKCVDGVKRNELGGVTLEVKTGMLATIASGMVEAASLELDAGAVLLPIQEVCEWSELWSEAEDVLQCRRLSLARTAWREALLRLPSGRCVLQPFGISNVELAGQYFDDRREWPSDLVETLARIALLTYPDACAKMDQSNYLPHLFVRYRLLLVMDDPHECSRALLVAACFSAREAGDLALLTLVRQLRECIVIGGIRKEDLTAVANCMIEVGSGVSESRPLELVEAREIEFLKNELSAADQEVDDVLQALSRVRD